jgi:peptidoglycan/LPS O-acetylase OafA/YrhL
VESDAIPKAPAPRLAWLDGVKGLAILWIVFFHFFKTYEDNRFPDALRAGYFAKFLSLCGTDSAASASLCVAKGFFVAVSNVGFHAVGVFLLMSGFGLTFSLARTGNPQDGWRGWYRSRVLRLFPMYWVAHLIYLLSPFQAHLEPLDYRFILSFLGDRIVPIYMIFSYANAAWWYFDLILELYIVFPLLFRLLQKTGAGWFLVLCGLATIASRYVLLFVIPASGNWLLGGFFGCRLWEFALGMVVGLWYRQNRAWVDVRLFNPITLVAGVLIYTAGIYSYGSRITYTLTDGLIGTGLSVVIAHIAYQSRRLPAFESAIAYVGIFSYGLYLIHQPYVIYFGERMRWMPLYGFVAAACPIIALLAIFSAQLEKNVNRVVNFEFRRPAKVHPSVTGDSAAGSALGGGRPKKAM